MDALKNKTWDKAGQAREGEREREREQEENIKEEGQEREREREERQLERGARRSPACCQVPGFPSPLHKRARQAWIGGGGSREARGPFTKSPAPPPSLEAFTPPPPPPWQQLESTIIPSSAIWHSSTSQLSSPLLPHSFAHTDVHTHTHPDTKGP